MWLLCTILEVPLSTYVKSIAKFRDRNALTALERCMEVWKDHLDRINSASIPMVIWNYKQQEERTKMAEKIE